LKQVFTTSRNKPSSFRDVFFHLFVPEKDPAGVYVYLAILTFVALILRFFVITNPIGYDEAYTFINFSSKPFKFILADYHAPNNHIFNSLLIGIFYRLLGNQVWIVRAPAFLASLLTVPAAFVTGRRYFSASLAITATAAASITPDLVLEAANGRGYPMIILFSLLLANFAGILVREQSRSALVAYALTGALGFYTIPIFLYPMAGISLWVAMTYLVKDEQWQTKWERLKIFLFTCFVSGILTFILYSPVIFFGTGFQSLIANEIVKSQTWDEFIVNLITRSTNTWTSWLMYAPQVIKQTLLGGFVISLIFYRKITNQKLPLQVSLVLGASLMLLLQRVAPLARIWSYLETFYLIFAAAGLAWLIFLVAKAITSEQKATKIVSSLILVIVLAWFTYKTATTQNKKALMDRTIAPEQLAAEYLAEHITENDTIVSIAPTDLQTAYYLKINGGSYEVFYQRDHPVDIHNALVIVRTRGEAKFNTLQGVLDFYKLTSSLNMDAATVVFEYRPLLIYSVPAKELTAKPNNKR